MPLPRPMSEDAWQTRVMGAAKLFGWRRVHIRAVRGPKGWAVPYSGDSGLPDLVLAKGGVVLLVELKTNVGRVTAEQALWLEAAAPFGQLWRPKHWAHVCAILDGSRDPEMGV